MSLKVFEAFAGIGAQHSALKRTNIDFEVVGISDWFINAVLAYDKIHTSNVVVDENNTDLLDIFKNEAFYISLFIFALMTFLIFRFKKLHPILIICLSAVIGIAAGYLFAIPPLSV